MAAHIYWLMPGRNDPTHVHKRRNTKRECDGAKEPQSESNTRDKMLSPEIYHPYGQTNGRGLAWGREQRDIGYFGWHWQTLCTIRIPNTPGQMELGGGGWFWGSLDHLACELCRCFDSRAQGRELDSDSFWTSATGLSIWNCQKINSKIAHRPVKKQQWKVGAKANGKGQ